MLLLSNRFRDETLADRRLLHEHVKTENAARENFAQSISSISERQDLNRKKIECDLAKIAERQHHQIENNLVISDALRTIRDEISTINDKLSRVTEQGSQNVWQVAERDGITFFLDNRSLVDKCILETGVWEAEQIDFITSLAHRISNNNPFYFLDVGSYFGYYSLIFNKRFPECRIFTFEANPMTYIQLKANLLCNNVHDRVTALNAVVCSSSGKTSVSNHENLLENRGGWSVNSGDGTTSTMVDNIVIDEYFSDLNNQFIVLKIDVEGYEAEVIPGLVKLLGRNKVLIQVECFDFDETLWNKFEASIKGLGLTKIHQLQYDHYFTNFYDEDLIVSPKDVRVPAQMFFTGLDTRNSSGHINFDESVQGHITYGPCMWVRQGKEKILFRFSPGTVLSNCSIDIFSNYAHSRGETSVLHTELVGEHNYDDATGELTIHYVHPASYCDIEFRLHTHGNSRGTFISADICPQ